MKTYIHHDIKGRIRGLITINAPDHVGMMLTPKPGVFLSEGQPMKFKSDHPTLTELKGAIKKIKSDSSSRGQGKKKK